MSKLRVHNFAISLDGYGAGPRQGLKDPLGVGGEELHGWYIGTRAFREINGKTGGTTGPDNDFAKRFGERIGAYIMGRNMFGPVRGPWPDDRWRGWWGENPPYHTPVFVLTNHARKPITMKGGTVLSQSMSWYSLASMPSPGGPTSAMMSSSFVNAAPQQRSAFSSTPTMPMTTVGGMPPLGVSLYRLTL